MTRSDDRGVNRREFFRTAGGALTAAGLVMTPRGEALAQSLAEKARLERIASCTWPIRSLFKTRAGAGRGGRGAGGGGRGAGGGAGEGAAAAEATRVPAIPENRDRTTAADMKARYGEITMLDFPQWTKDNFPGVTRMDLFSGLFGDVTDESMFITAEQGGGGGGGFDPLSPSGRKWLDALASTCVRTGTKVQHISNNAPFGLAEHGSPEADARRKAGVAMARRWLQGCAVLGVRSMRMNSTSALGPPIRPNAIPRSGDGYPRNLDIVPMLDAAIESYKEMADYGGEVGIKVTIENHWGLAADPQNIRIIIDAVNHPFCEASPDFCNWEHEYMLVSGLRALAPYSHTNAHAKYWDRWGDKNDVQRGVHIMLAGGFKGTFALEYEAGPLNGVEGAKYLYKEVLAALGSAPVE
ncbi:MAG TPA: TIM barrel protein [Vicinamibacterales bacterium]|nr:TIM barrel protein [Vicinamibacterales bacterium]